MLYYHISYNKSFFCDLLFKFLPFLNLSLFTEIHALFDAGEDLCCKLFPLFITSDVNLVCFIDQEQTIWESRPQTEVHKKLLCTKTLQQFGHNLRMFMEQ